MSRAVFTRKQKLTKPLEFKRVFRKPLVSSDACFKVFARLGEQSEPRLGMAVSTQIDKKAVGRNRIKRVIRESFRRYFSDRDTPMDIVVLPRLEAATLSNQVLSRSLQSHWSRLERRLEG